MATTNGEKPSVCFVAINSYAVLSGRTDLKHIGGAEIQQPMIARELAARGYSVRFVTLDHGQPDGQAISGIRVFTAYRVDAGLPVVRFIHPRWTGLRSAMARADADVYYQMIAGAETGQVAAWCKHHQRRFVFATASDTDCDPALPALRRRRERTLYRWGLRRADRVIAQTHGQQQSLTEGFGVASDLIPSCSHDPGDVAVAGRRPPQPNEARALWIGRLSPEKRPEWFFDLAERLSHVQFDCVGDAKHEDNFVRSLKERAAVIPNLTLHGRLPHDQVGPFYESAAFLLCTSVFEGYPNTFMEAWARGCPTVSTVDPDQVVTRHDLGRIGDTVEALAQAAGELLKYPDRWRRCSSAARDFFINQHTVPSVVDRLERVIARVLSSEQLVQPVGVGD